MRTVVALNDWAGFMHVFSICHISFEVRALNKAQKAQLSDLEGVHQDGWLWLYLSSALTFHEAAPIPTFATHCTDFG
jgi:hypothetical protein